MITPTECPRWASCSAPVCPLNRSGEHLEGKPICFYAMEVVKFDAYPHFEGNDLLWLYEAMKNNLHWLYDQSADLRKRLTRSSMTPSRQAV
ncbi:hypothetical protein [Amphritea sp. HPY]|uniref:hypothetical protein n=1 Tax=Amphritea sp. HPY TaxID=3421652 RepID=UPI003D7DDD5C